LKYTVYLSALAAAMLLNACATTSKSETADLFKPTTSIQDIMLSIIDPNIDFVWNSVATISTAQGTEERRPHTDAEWQQLKQHALVVLEASNLLLIEGRPVAQHAANTSSGGAELSAAEIQKAIAANRADYIQRAHALHKATESVIAAIDHKNVEQLVETGGAVDQACEQCHSQFWYPNDKRPK